MRVSNMATGGSALSYTTVVEAAHRQAADDAPVQPPEASAQPPEAQGAAESPKEKQKKTPPPPSRSLATAVLNGCVGKFYRVMEDVTNILTDEELKLPQIVVIGEESSGKSSVLESVAMLPLFPRESDICTRMPILLKMSHGNFEVQGDPELMPHCKGNPQPTDQQTPTYQLIKMRLIYSDDRAPIESERLFTLQQAAELMRKWMEQIVREEHDANKLAGVVEHVLEIEVRAPNLPNLKLVDLPGIVAGKLIDEPEDMMQRTRALVKKYLKMPDTLVLAVVPAFERVRNSQAFQLVQQYKLADKTIGVLTMVDRAQDETNPEGPLTQVKNRLDGTSSDIVYLKEGYVAVRNRNTRLVPEVSLEEFKEEEDAWLEENLPGYINRHLASSTVLVENLEKMLADHVRQSWVPQTLTKMKKESEKVAHNLASLGPDAQDIFNDFLRVSQSVARKQMLQLIEPILPELMSSVDEVMLQFAALVHADFMESRDEHELILAPLCATMQLSFKTNAASLVAASKVMLGSHDTYTADNLVRILKNVVLHIVSLVQKTIGSERNAQRLDRFANLHYFFAGILWERLNELLIDEDDLLGRLKNSFLEFDPENASNLQLPSSTKKISAKKASELKILANDLELYLASRGFHNTSFDEVYLPTDTSKKTPLTREMSRLIISAQVPTLGKARPRGLKQGSGQNGFSFGSSFTPNASAAGAKQPIEESQEASEFELRLFFALTSHVVAPLVQSICDVSGLVRKMQEYASCFPKASACKTHIFRDTTAEKRKKLMKKMKRLDAAAEGLKSHFP
ncbi:hypothetical protein JG687_00011224 [Phytophthora cactorum]|uniref:Dynamin-type G domain-containing protein n=1 Tax=Phytophthora cactorum TaxID=29920 RepID=A0A329SBT5_9STRA|nr:hypothetical protein Pcac1_g15708 [Phytophthora cactorum]KAG2806816.1 hypothetical protein PC112_g17689 [Phytophthora cactorum]KAG2808494.1 hypothetical protein PC111_g16470 [Phytophthora cactorum]KAG2847672.1 hypothetical protein PC113_g17711 [Phytophthora cactorum]KAG2890910.1 hypothetical protein PC114_g17230 [Phytophthora cactorum]